MINLNTRIPPEHYEHLQKTYGKNMAKKVREAIAKIVKEDKEKQNEQAGTSKTGTGV